MVVEQPNNKPNRKLVPAAQVSVDMLNSAPYCIYHARLPFFRRRRHFGARHEPPLLLFRRPATQEHEVKGKQIPTSLSKNIVLSWT